MRLLSEDCSPCEVISNPPIALFCCRMCSRTCYSVIIDHVIIHNTHGTSPAKSGAHKLASTRMKITCASESSWLGGESPSQQTTKHWELLLLCPCSVWRSGCCVVKQFLKIFMRGKMLSFLWAALSGADGLLFFNITKGKRRKKNPALGKYPAIGIWGLAVKA